MSRLRDFVEGAAEVAAIQGQILSSMENVFRDEYRPIETTILAPGLDGWESRAIQLVKQKVGESFSALKAEVSEINAKYKTAVPHPNQSQEYWVDPLTAPHLRVYYCLRCGYAVTSLALSGMCCHGQPECPRCKHTVHEPSCRKAPPATQEQP